MYIMYVHTLCILECNTFCDTTISILLFQLIILLYVFRKQSLLHPEIENDSNIVSGLDTVAIV